MSAPQLPGSLVDNPRLDRWIRFEDDRTVREIVAEGHDAALVARIARLVDANEYKRRQAPVGPRITHRGFGKDWRYPITNRFM